MLVDDLCLDVNLNKGTVTMDMIKKAMETNSKIKMIVEMDDDFFMIYLDKMIVLLEF